jgi:hypothetical protein
MEYPANPEAAAKLMLHKKGYGDWNALLQAIGPQSTLERSNRSQLARLGLHAHPTRRIEIHHSYGTFKSA